MAPVARRKRLSQIKYTNKNLHQPQPSTSTTGTNHQIPPPTSSTSNHQPLPSTSTTGTNHQIPPPSSSTSNQEPQPSTSTTGPTDQIPPPSSSTSNHEPQPSTSTTIHTEQRVARRKPTHQEPARKNRRIETLPTRTSTRIAAQPPVFYHSQVAIIQYDEPLQNNIDDPAPVDNHNIGALHEPPAHDPPLHAVQLRIQTDSLPATCFAARIPYNNEQINSFIGNMDKKCRFCGALLFPAEMKQQSSTICCHNGKIKLQDIEVPPVLKNLIERNDATSKKYLNQVRQYNCALAFASVTAHSVPFNRGPYCYKIHGQIYHSIGALNVPQGQAPMYASLFIIDSEEALQLRMGNSANKECDRNIMNTLQQMLQRYNPYAQLFSSVHALADNTQPIDLHFTLNNTFDRRRYNIPTSHDEIAAVFTSTDGAPPSTYEFVVYYKNDGRLTRINNINPHCDPMCYPLLFPCGDSSWRPGMAHVDIHSTATRHTTTQLQFYCYRLAVREGFNLLHSSGKLFQQFVVDSYCKVLGGRIAYIRTHQKELRAETYKGLADYLLSDEQGLLPGVPVVLPSTFIGSPRNMIQNYQDAMSIVSRFGKPDLFITFTCNPRWEEIVTNLKPYETAHNRPDLVTRVFSCKLQLLLICLLKEHVLGVVIAYVYVIKFQKRGLPHVHILLILREEDKIRDPSDVDRVVSAEIPDPHEEPELHAIVNQCMIHGPCGQYNIQAPCMDEGKCTKDFPKQFSDQTVMNVNGYPLYRRRNNGRTVVKDNAVLGNDYVVPYNKYLSLKFKAHINVEICSSVRSVKYLYKYVYKGHDCAAVRLRATQENVPPDEVEKFLNYRYVSSPEAMWRLHERPLYSKSHTIERLPVHLHQGQIVYFPAGAPRADRQNMLPQEEKKTKLTAFFQLCHQDESARQYFYSQIPEHYVWANNQWKPRQRITKCLGRVYTVNPRDQERFSLRLLLLNVKGPTSFEFLRTVNGTTYETFTDAARKLNLLDNNEEYFQCLEEASTFQMPVQLRHLFATLCIFCSPNNADHLWETFKEALSEDYRRQHDENTSFEMALLGLQNFFQIHGQTCATFRLPTPTITQHVQPIPHNLQKNADAGRQLYERLNQEQRSIVDEIMQTLASDSSRCFFIDGPGGTGKTFVYTTLHCRIRA